MRDVDDQFDLVTGCPELEYAERCGRLEPDADRGDPLEAAKAGHLAELRETGDADEVPVAGGKARSGGGADVHEELRMTGGRDEPARALGVEGAHVSDVVTGNAANAGEAHHTPSATAMPPSRTTSRLTSSALTTAAPRSCGMGASAALGR